MAGRFTSRDTIGIWGDGGSGLGVIYVDHNHFRGNGGGIVFDSGDGIVGGSYNFESGDTSRMGLVGRFYADENGFYTDENGFYADENGLFSDRDVLLNLDGKGCDVMPGDNSQLLPVNSSAQALATIQTREEYWVMRKFVTSSSHVYFGGQALSVFIPDVIALPVNPSSNNYCGGCSADW